MLTVVSKAHQTSATGSDDDPSLKHHTVCVCVCVCVRSNSITTSSKQTNNTTIVFNNFKQGFILQASWRSGGSSEVHCTQV